MNLEHPVFLRLNGFFQDLCERPFVVGAVPPTRQTSEERILTDALGAEYYDYDALLIQEVERLNTNEFPNRVIDADACGEHTLLIEEAMRVARELVEKKRPDRPIVIGNSFLLGHFGLHPPRMAYDASRGSGGILWLLPMIKRQGVWRINDQCEYRPGIHIETFDLWPLWSHEHG